MLMLQKPFKKSKAKDHLKFLEKRLKWWSDGEIDLIYKECEAIQQELLKSKTRQSNINKVFAKLVFEGRLTTAMNLIEQEASKGVLQPNENVLKELRKLHPPRRHVTTSEMIQGSPAETNPVIFESINHSAIYHSAMQRRGSGGPSGLDAANFRRMVCSTKFKQVSESFCTTVSEIARKICCEEVDPNALETYTACRTIALDKDGQGAVRSIGIGEILRRVIG